MSDEPICTMTPDEARVLDVAGFATDSEEADGGCAWLRLSEHHRDWVIDTPQGRLHHRVDDEHGEGPLIGLWLPVSERIIDFVAMIQEDETVDLRLVDGTVVASVLGLSAAIDLVPTSAPDPTLFEIRYDACASLPLHRLVALLRTARRLPTGVSLADIVPPPMWLQFDERELAVHVNWSASFDSRSTYRADLDNSAGEGLVPVSPGVFSSFITHIPAHEDATILIGFGIDSIRGERHLCLSNGFWTFTTPAPDPLLARWAFTIDQQCAADGIAISTQHETEWVLAHDECVVRLTLHHGNPDTARISGAIVNDIDTTPELLLELNELNIASTAVRFCLADRAVRAIVDLPCTELSRLGAVVQSVTDSMRRFGVVLGALAAVGAADR